MSVPTDQLMIVLNSVLILLVVMSVIVMMDTEQLLLTLHSVKVRSYINSLNFVFITVCIWIVLHVSVISDIDECDGYNDCHQMCTNTEGSYYCSCNTGFVLEADNRTCRGYCLAMLLMFG